MSDLWKKAVWWWLTAVACIAEAVVATLLAAGKIAAAPFWLATVAAVLVAIVGIVLGKPWAWPKPPD